MISLGTGEKILTNEGWVAIEDISGQFVYVDPLRREFRTQTGYKQIANEPALSYSVKGVTVSDGGADFTVAPTVRISDTNVSYDFETTLLADAVATVVTTANEGFVDTTPTITVVVDEADEGNATNPTLVAVMATTGVVGAVDLEIEHGITIRLSPDCYVLGSLTPEARNFDWIKASDLENYSENDGMYLLTYQEYFQSLEQKPEDAINNEAGYGTALVIAAGTSSDVNGEECYTFLVPTAERGITFVTTGGLIVQYRP